MIELNFPNPVREEKDFYGRRAELARIEQVFRSGTRRPVAVYGERRMGKTSLMNVVAARLQGGPSPGLVALFPATVGIHSLQDFAREALQSLCAWRGTSLPERGLVGRDGQYRLSSTGQLLSQMRELLQGSSAGLHLLCIDEIDALLYNCAEYGQPVEAVKILHLCHELVTQTDLPLTFFFTLTRLPGPIRDSFHTLITEEAERVDLVPLSAEAVGALLDGIFGPRVTFETVERRKLERLSGGHPYLLKLLLANWLDQHPVLAPQVRATTASLEQATADAARDPRAEHALGNLLRVHFDRQERDLLTLIAGLEGCVTPAQLDAADKVWRTVAEGLVRRWYLLYDPEQEAYTFRALLLGRWLRQRPAFEEQLYHLDEVRKRMIGAPREEGQAEPAAPGRTAKGVEIEILACQRRLLVRGRPVRITPQEYQILSLLCKQGERVVTKDELAGHLWPEAAGDVSDAAIDATIYRLRRKLGDDARQPRYLETVVGHGFILHRAAFVGTDETTEES